MAKKTIDPNLFEKLFRKSQEYVKSSKKNKPIADKWFFIANNDIEITKVLYANKHFAGSAYHLQQAFEKLIKGYYILSGREAPDKVNSHLYVLDKLKSEVKDEYIDTFLKLSKSINDTQIDLESADKALSVINKSEDAIRLLDKESLNEILNLIKKLESVLMSVETVEKAKEKFQKKKFIAMIKHLLSNILHRRIYNSEVRDAVKQEQIVFYLNGAVINIKLQLIAIFTFLHFNTPRYPYDIRKNNPSKVTFFDYTEDLGIISILPELIVLFEEIYSDLTAESNKYN